MILGVALPELVVGSLILHPIANVVLVQGLMGKLGQAKLLAYKVRAPPEAEVAHALQGVLAGDPLHLVNIEAPRASVTLGFLNKEPPTSPPSNYMKLAGQLDTGPIEDIRRPQPLPGV